MADLPLVSVVMANYRSARFLRDAIDSVLKQTMTDLELIIVDDVSNDGSLQIIEEYIEHDSRVRLIALSQNLGPSGARNRGLEEARGEWIAIVDSDDHIHPERFKILIAAAERDGADLVADDLLIFDDSGSEVTTMLNRDTEGFWVGEAEFIRANSLYSSGPVLGYCKPLIRRSALAETRYDTTLRIGEDFDLILRLLFAGCKFKIYPDLLYFYRKHSGSISHRFNKAECLTLLAAEVDRVPPPNAVTPEITSALAFRIASLRRALAFAELVQCLKTLSLRGVVRTLWRNPSVLAASATPDHRTCSKIYAESYRESYPNFPVVDWCANNCRSQSPAHRWTNERQFDLFDEYRAISARARISCELRFTVARNVRSEALCRPECRHVRGLRSCRHARWNATGVCRACA